MISWIGEQFFGCTLLMRLGKLGNLNTLRVTVCVCVCVAKMFQRFRHEMLNDCKQSHHTNWMNTKELINLNQCI